MTVQAPPWLVWLMLALAACGLWSACWALKRTGEQTAGWIADWWRWWPLGPEHRIPRGMDPDCWYDTHEDCLGCNCACHENDPGELPPEQSWKEMIEHPPGVLAHLDAGLERRSSWWEAEHRAAYESLGLDYPSGMIARIRELVP